MRRGNRRIPARHWLATLGLGGLAACHTLQPARPLTDTMPATVAPTAVAAAPVQAETIAPAMGAADPQSEVPPTAAIPDCVPPAAKVKPKSKPKARSVHAAPPQLPTVTEMAQAPADAVVDAQVRPLSVSVTSILGKQVRGPHGDDLGRVVDVLADANGRVRVAIIDFGGFLGVGDKRIAVDWPLLRFNPDRNASALLLSVERERLKAAPEYKDTPKPQTLMEPTAPPAPSADTK